MPVGVATALKAESHNATAVVVEWTPVPLIREFVRGKVIGYGVSRYVLDLGLIIIFRISHYI